jgi:hypothetical protein
MGNEEEFVNEGKTGRGEDLLCWNNPRIGG